MSNNMKNGNYNARYTIVQDLNGVGAPHAAGKKKKCEYANLRLTCS